MCFDSVSELDNFSWLLHNLRKNIPNKSKGDILKKFEKMLMAIDEPELNCYGSKGSWLYLAGKKDTKKGLFRLPREHYYFISLDEQRLPSEIGVVKKWPEPITAQELAIKDYESKNMSFLSLDDEVIKEYERFLEKVNAQPEHTPMALTWLGKPLSNTRQLRFHKVFFTGLTPEEKKELFEK